MKPCEQVTVRPAAWADLLAITTIAQATGQEEDWVDVFPAYVRHVMTHGSFLVAERDGSVTGYGGALRIGTGPLSACMLTDLFVDPAAHGTGTGRAILRSLWRDEPRRMTFSSLHSHALPLYTSFGLDAWWPLLYLKGEVRRLPMPPGWSVEPASAREVASLELAWTGLDRTAQHELWEAWPNGAGLVASQDGRSVAAATVGGAAAEYGICHLSLDTATVSDKGARDAVTAVLSSLRPQDGQARVCLPAPHPATRALLEAGWRVQEFDLYMASEFGLVDPRRAVLSPGLA